MNDDEMEAQMEYWKQRAEAAEAQLAAVDEALPKWQAPPNSETGCVGRVQTILNILAERDEARRERDSWRKLAEGWKLTDDVERHRV